MKHVLYLENGVWFSVTIPFSGPPMVDSWSVPNQKSKSCPPVGDWKGNKNVNLKCARPKKNFCKNSSCGDDEECYNLLSAPSCVSSAPLFNSARHVLTAPCSKFMLNDQICLFGGSNSDGTHVYACGNSIVGFWKSRGWFHTHSHEALR